MPEQEQAWPSGKCQLSSLKNIKILQQPPPSQVDLNSGFGEDLMSKHPSLGWLLLVGAKKRIFFTKKSLFQIHYKPGRWGSEFRLCGNTWQRCSGWHRVTWAQHPHLWGSGRSHGIPQLECGWEGVIDSPTPSGSGNFNIFYYILIY